MMKSVCVCFARQGSAHALCVTSRSFQPMANDSRTTRQQHGTCGKEGTVLREEVRSSV